MITILYQTNNPSFNEMRRPSTPVKPHKKTAVCNFIKAFFPPKSDPDFLLTLAGETWRTVAMATAGMTLALLLALPLALLSVRVLSLSALAGNMAFLPSAFRQVVRWKLMVLRSVPELTARFDMLVFFTAFGIKSLFENFPDFVQGDRRIACFSIAAQQAAIEHGLRVDIPAPTPEAPAITTAIDLYLQTTNLPVATK